jgi:hypothetical protein
MRPQQKPNRTRGRGNRKPNGNNMNRVYESNGPEGKVRGTPQQIIEKYLSLARDAQTSSNRVMAENFLQHAEHYQRLLAETMGVQPDRQDNQQAQNQYDGDDTGDSDSESDGDDTAGGANRQHSDDHAQTSRRPDRQNDRPDNRRANGHVVGQGGHRTDRKNDNRSPRESEVSGLTMIDSGSADTDSLLVDAEDVSASQPRRRRRAPDVAKSPAAPNPAEPPAE